MVASITQRFVWVAGEFLPCPSWRDFTSSYLISVSVCLLNWVCTYFSNLFCILCISAICSISLIPLPLCLIFFSRTLYSSSWLYILPSFHTPRQYSTDFPLTKQHLLGSEGSLFQRFSFKAKSALIPTGRLRRELREIYFGKARAEGRTFFEQRGMTFIHSILSVLCGN